MKIFLFKIIVSLVNIFVLHGINLQLTGGKPGLCNKLCFFFFLQKGINIFCFNYNGFVRDGLLFLKKCNVVLQNSLIFTLLRFWLPYCRNWDQGLQIDFESFTVFTYKAFREVLIFGLCRTEMTQVSCRKKGQLVNRLC